MGSGEKWLNCKSDFLVKYLKPGAAGPAQLPVRVPAGGRVQRREPAGQASGPQLPLEGRQRPHKRLDVYRLTAHFCPCSLQHAGRPALLLRRGQPAADPGQGCQRPRPGQHRRLPRAALQGGHAALDPV
ncbi:unnamed protein product [Rangifer tarandus platyrhynchus]|uniref:Uncharacterized protein n=2 Tax=Rangifer tarandus platyrhynchus TaxID=3082113 RepID=A0AC60A5I6_RANTA|nr:unnamed protein product [Rangifer tarandus platyrhynchus]